MIPKIIHYAWFGSELPENISQRVRCWKQILPDWRFILWNEDNFDISKFNFTKEMYDKGKFGYAADELRFDVLYRYGGFYLDTDMLLKRDLSIFLKHKMVWGFQYDNSILTSMIGSEPNQSLLMDILDVYEDHKYSDIKDSSVGMISNPFVTKILIREYSDFLTNGQYQELEPGIIVFPKDYFTYQSKNINANYSEHLFDNSWGDSNNGIRGFIKYKFKSCFPYIWARVSAQRGAKLVEKDGIPLIKQDRVK